MRQTRLFIAVGAVAILAILLLNAARRSSSSRGAPGAASARAGRDGKVPHRGALKPLVVTTAAAGPQDGRIVTKSGWGSDRDQVGFRPAAESNPEGPMAVVAGPHGLLVLDQVNGRIVKYGPDGKVLGTFPIGPDTAQDLAVTADGKVAVLDRVDDGQVLQYDADGNLIGQAPVVGGPLTEAGGATGVFSDSSGTYVEREHGETVRVLGPDGLPDHDRPTRPGRPLRDGTGYVQAMIADKAGGLATVRVFDEASDFVWQRTVTFPGAILSLLLLDSDRQGRLVIAAHVGTEGTAPPYDMINEKTIVVGMAQSDGESRGSIAIPAPSTTDEMLRPLTISDDGVIYQMTTSDHGIEVHAYAMP